MFLTYRRDERTFANRQGWDIGSPDEINETAADDAEDAYDDMLLGQGRHAELLARHYEALRERTRLHVPAPDCDDVLQAALERLVKGLQKGRTHPVPFRVVAHKVLGWSIADRHKAAAGRAGAVVESDLVDPVDDHEGVEMRLTVDAIIASLPEGDRVPTRLRFVEGCEISEIARRLGRTRNAIDQALFRGRNHLKRELDHGRG